MAKPSFGIIGAGVSGSFAAWTLLNSTNAAAVKVFEMGRGAGGRCSSRRTREIKGFYVDHGCPAFTATEKVPGWKDTVATLVDRGLIEHWKCTTGYLESDGRAAEAACEPLYRGINGMDSMCTRLLEGAETNFSTAVKHIDHDGKQWVLYDKTKSELARVDHLVITSVAIACNIRWARIFGEGPSPLMQCAEKLQSPMMSQCVEMLDRNGDSAKPVFSLLMAYERGLAPALPFDLNIVRGHPHISKVVHNQCGTAQYDTIVVHSTHEFAQQATDVFGSKSSVSQMQDKPRSDDSKQREVELQDRLMSSWMSLAKAASGAEVAQPQWGPYLHRWGSAFSTELMTEPVTLEGLNLSVCGDFVGSRAGNVESAAASGCQVAQTAMAAHSRSGL